MAVNAKPLLLVDDEALIVCLVEDALLDAGFAVACASTGDEAIVRLSEMPGQYLGLITDIRMAGASDGWDVARHARGQEATLPVIYMTGDSAGDWVTNGVPHSIMIQKPFATAEIIAAVSALLSNANLI